MDFKRKETTNKDKDGVTKVFTDPVGPIEQRIIDMKKLHPELNLTGLSRKLSKSVNISDKISAVGMRYAIKIIESIIQDTEGSNLSDGELMDNIYDNL